MFVPRLIKLLVTFMANQNEVLDVVELGLRDGSISPWTTTAEGVDMSPLADIYVLLGNR